jgi:hypothetical protein
MIVIDACEALCITAHSREPVKQASHGDIANPYQKKQYLYQSIRHSKRKHAYHTPDNESPEERLLHLLMLDKIVRRFLLTLAAAELWRIFV